MIVPDAAGASRLTGWKAFGANVGAMQLRLPRPRFKAPTSDAAVNTVVTALAVTACIAVYATWRFSKLMP